MRSHYHRAIARLDAALTGPVWWGSLQDMIPWAAQDTEDSDFEDAEEPEEAFVIVSPVRGVRYKIKVLIEFETGKDLANKVKDEMGLPRDARVELLYEYGEPIKPNVQLAKQGIVGGTKLKAENPVEALVIVSTLDGGEYEIQVRDGFETGKRLANEVKFKMELPRDAKVELYEDGVPIKPNVQLAKPGIVDGTKLKLEAKVSTNKPLRDDNDENDENGGISIKEAIKMWMDTATKQGVVDEYGDIWEWNTSQVTDTSQLLEWKLCVLHDY